MLRAYNAHQQIFLTFAVRLLVCAVCKPNQSDHVIGHLKVSLHFSPFNVISLEKENDILKTPKGSSVGKSFTFVLTVCYTLHSHYSDLQLD